MPKQPQRRFLIDAIELIDDTHTQPVKLALQPENDHYGRLFIDFARSSPYGTIVELSPKESDELVVLFHSPNTGTSTK